MEFRFSHIHIVGASGSGTTTLARALAGELVARHLDTDAYFWLPTTPPFTTKRPVDERLEMLGADLDAQPRWVLSGSLLSWGLPLAPRFDLVVFLFVAPEVRMARTLAREVERYGDDILPGGPMHSQHLEFLDWSRTYDHPAATGRSLATHRAWLATLTCPVLEIAGTQPVEETVSRVLAFNP